MELKPCRKCGRQPSYQPTLNYYVCGYCADLEQQYRMERAATYWNEDNHVE